MTGTIEEIGSDIHRMKEIGVDHIILDYAHSPEGRNMMKVIDVSKQLLKFTG